jgi:hypothetical protein
MNKVIKIVEDKVRETLAKETAEWKAAYEAHLEKQKEIAKLNEPKRIGFKF